MTNIQRSEMDKNHFEIYNMGGSICAKLRSVTNTVSQPKKNCNVEVQVISFSAFLTKRKQFVRMMAV